MKYVFNLKKCVVVVLLLKLLFLDPFALAQEISCDNDLNNCLRSQPHRTDPITTATILLTGYVSSAGGLPALGPFIGLAALASLVSLSFLNPEPSFEQKLTADLKTLKSEDLPKINKSICMQNGNVLDILSEIPKNFDITQALMGANKIYELANNSEDRLKTFEDSLLKFGEFETLNTQAANVTIHTENNMLKIESGGNKEDKFKKAFYLPKLVKGTKDILRQNATIRAHTALALLFEKNEITNVFNETLNLIPTKTDDLHKQLIRGYRIVQRNNDTPNPLVKSFIEGEFKEAYNLNSIADFTFEDKERETLTSYTQRLLQDLNISGPTNGTFTATQLTALSNITPSMTDSVTHEDLKYLKDAAYKVRGFLLGLSLGEILVNSDREDGNHTFIGSILGNYARGSLSDITYGDIVNKIARGESDSEILDYILSSGISRAVFDRKSENILDFITDQISILLPGQRRKDFINSTLELILTLRNYAISSTNTASDRELEAVELTLLGYKKLEGWLKNKEDYFGVIFNSEQAKLNLVKKVNKDKHTTANNSAIARIEILGPRKYLKDVLKTRAISREDRIEIAAYAAIAMARGYINGLKRMADDENDASLPRISSEYRAERVTIELDKIRIAAHEGGLKAAIKSLKNLARLNKLTDGKNYRHYIPVETYRENTPAGHYQLQRYLLTYATDVLMAKTRELEEYANLIIQLDSEFANVVIDGKTVKDTVKEILGISLKDKTFLIDGVFSDIKRPYTDEWIELVDSNGEIPDDDGDEEIFTKKQKEFPHRKVNRKSVDNLDFDDYLTLIKNNVIEETFSDTKTKFSLNATVCATKVENLDQAPKGSYLKKFNLSAVNNIQGVIDSFEYSGELKLDNDYSRISGDLLIKDTHTGKYIYQEPIVIKTKGALLKGNVITIQQANHAVQTIIDQIKLHAAKQGIPPHVYAKRLVGKIVFYAPKVTVGILVLVAEASLEAMLEEIVKRLYQEINEQFNTDDEKPPFASCRAVPRVVNPGDKVDIYYLTINARQTGVSVDPGETYGFLATPEGMITIHPEEDTDISVLARNKKYEHIGYCYVDVIDEEPSYVTGKVDKTFFDSKTGNDLFNTKNTWNYPVSFKVDGEEFEVNSENNSSEVIAVKPNKEYETILNVNDVDTIKKEFYAQESMSHTINHYGGIFRHYSSARGLDGILASQTIFKSPFGDLWQVDPTSKGSGVYFTDLNMKPKTENYSLKIARLLRIFKDITFEQLKNLPVQSSYPYALVGDKNAYIDFVINNELNLLRSNSGFKYQFLYPSQVQFSNPYFFKINHESFTPTP